MAMAICSSVPILSAAGPLYPPVPGRWFYIKKCLKSYTIADIMWIFMTYFCCPQINPQWGRPKSWVMNSFIHIVHSFYPAIRILQKPISTENCFAVVLKISALTLN
jgi:hypothetical protein